MKAKSNYDVGVIIGRFQVHELHDAHRRLIETVCSSHDKVIIFLGLSPIMVTKENPLDFEARKQMILEEFPHVNVLYIKDTNDDEIWSNKLDEMISDVITPSQKPLLYGGRDSFISSYTGKYDTIELEPDTYVKFSGKEIRNGIATKRTVASPDFRAGVVWASQSRFPTVYTTVDMALFKTDAYDTLLLGKKPNESLWRFIGGFSEPTSPSFEADVKRELREEANISEIKDLEYIGSFNIDDWRYRKEVDIIRTLFYAAVYNWGAIKPGDDIAEVKWFDLNNLKRENIMPAHRVLFDGLLSWLHGF